ncbi:MAG: AraC family transcriptional regulator [Chitinophagaceae bacterium]
MGKANNYFKGKMVKMEGSSSTRRLMILLEILIYLSTSKDIRPVLSKAITARNSTVTDRIDEVFQFITKNYKQEIYIEQIAEKLNMSIASFSRYFKHHTHKTFSQYITEIRISYACRLLMERNVTISEICYQSGFENQSNFYRHFKKNTGIIPKEYKCRFLSTAI